MRKATARQDAEKQFWTGVEELLIEHYRHLDSEARGGIGKYRGKVDRRKLGEVVYNQGEEHTAKVIDGIIRDGLPTPYSS
ncbi:MAG: hypothetical protein ACLQIB_48285 [Isosphaeraceae bacterium]